MKHPFPLYRIASISHGWFDALPENIRTEITGRCRPRQLTAGQRLFSRGDVPDGLYCVLDGSIRVSGISFDGQETVLDFYGPKSWFGEVSMLDGLPRLHDAEAYEQTSLLQLPSDDLEDLLLLHPAFSRGLLRLESLRVRLLLSALQSYSTQSLEQRLASRFMMLSVAYGAKSTQGIEIKLHLPQEVLAQLIGATRQRVNQIVGDWSDRGIVAQQYGRITLLNIQRLEELRRL